MGNNIIIYTKYANSGNDFGGGLEVSKFSVKKTGMQVSPNRMRVEFEGKGSVKRAWMFLDTEIAIPLARNLLSVAEGYVSESVSEVG